MTVTATASPNSNPYSNPSPNPNPYQAGVAQLACVRKADMRYDFKDAVLRLRCELAYIPR